MSVSLNKDAFPPWTKYVVLAYSDGEMLAAAPCSTIERAVQCMIQHGCALTCEVVRFEDDVMVWPLHAKGGDA